MPDPTRLTISSVLSNIRAHVDVADELIILGQSASQDQILTPLDTEPAIDAELYSFLAGEQRESFLAQCHYESETPAAH